ncbi:MAG: hypothetical protein COA78_01460 [Blastopirellula sp.]|nr:MAG: hypothetical protein COA78_01460 [Blastopirellula sp.]
MNFEQLHQQLAGQGIGIFNVEIDGYVRTLIHHDKTVEQWRKDVRQLLKKSKEKDSSGKAGTFNLPSSLIKEFGYHNVTSIVDDVYEGRLAIYETEIVDDPVHENQKDGFGHYGFVNSHLKIPEKKLD